MVASSQQSSDLLSDDSQRRKHRKQPPASLKKLGLSLPVTEGDVKQAYFAKAREAHPDHGGAAADFREVQQAFDEAIEFAKRSGKRLPWIGSQLPIYVAQQAAVDLVAGWGGKTRVESLDWLEDTVGEDFAILGDRLTEIDLSGRPIGDAEMAQLSEDTTKLPFLHTLNLSDTNVTDTGLSALPWLGSLKLLDLRRTNVSFGLRKRLAKSGIKRVAGTSRLGEMFGKR